MLDDDPFVRRLRVKLAALPKHELFNMPRARAKQLAAEVWTDLGLDYDGDWVQDTEAAFRLMRQKLAAEHRRHPTTPTSPDRITQILRESFQALRPRDPQSRQRNRRRLGAGDVDGESVERYWQEHIASLVARHNLGLRATLEGYSGACAFSGPGQLNVYQVRSPATYAVALHELGHILAAGADGHRQRHVIRDGSVIAPAAEIAAWRWAVLNALPRWTGEMQRRLERCMLTYNLEATDAERRQIVDLFFWGRSQIRRPEYVKTNFGWR